MELIELQYDIDTLRSKFNSQDVGWFDFYGKYIYPSWKYPTLAVHAIKIALISVSYYLFKLSTPKTFKNKID